MRADAVNSNGYPIRTEMNPPSSHVCSTDEDESEGIIVLKTLLQSCSTDEDQSKGIRVNVTLLQSCSMDEDKLCSKEEDKSECAIMKQKYENIEVTYDLPKYFNAFNIFKRGRKLLDRLDVSCERA